MTHHLNFEETCEHCGQTDLHLDPDCPGLRTRPACVMSEVHNGQTWRCTDPCGYEVVHIADGRYQAVEDPDGAWCHHHALKLAVALHTREVTHLDAYVEALIVVRQAVRQLGLGHNLMIEVVLNDLEERLVRLPRRAVRPEERAA